MEKEIKKYTLANALDYDGEANTGAVMSKVMGEREDLRNQAKEVKKTVQKIVKEINQMSIEEQRKKLQEIAPEMLQEEEIKEEQALPDLPGNTDKVRMRFAPNPSGPLHLGHARAAILNDEYVEKYNGKFILRIEDTDPKRVYPPAYEMIEEDIQYLEIDVDEKIIQGERIETYYEYAEQLIEMNKAYVCRCPAEQFRKLKKKGIACECRDQTPEKNLELWNKMLEGRYKEGEVAVRIKTHLNHPDPAIREWPAFRVVDQKHPVYGDRYNAYPLMNFSVAIDDHLMNISHIIRGKDHIPNKIRQEFIFDYFNWEKPEYIHHGTLSIEGVELSTRNIKKGIDEGKYTGWNDTRLGTLKALKKRGIQPKAIRESMKALGVSEVNSKFSWTTLYAENRKIIDKKADRYFFVPNPTEIKIENAEQYTATPPIHPDREETRQINVPKNPKILIPQKDADKMQKDDIIRLKDLYNIKITGQGTAKYIGNSLKVLQEGAQIIQWTTQDNIPIKIDKQGKTEKGVAEKTIKKLKPNQTIQFERYGFVRIDQKNPYKACYAHR
ncbi:Glutamyl-/glutaminyl-tRNA synthetase [Methanonatronarchaeum thermophilum]|uniref:Glutamate--tRNA ligase n=1 Tax=Methanonatronarchaeum thermophilum TaxID=1927129 RepID=A0A1Y3GCK1_9EURY|nr:glutamate--tRNA ligase [Methanonatronarchaeum thermophilum]OUJ18970.1 Glutamyl-/glutaminyl-tRNA synthetase [Methanonatronarchaeum thermophilum]